LDPNYPILILLMALYSHRTPATPKKALLSTHTKHLFPIQCYIFVKFNELVSIVVVVDKLPSRIIGRHLRFMKVLKNEIDS